MDLNRVYLENLKAAALVAPGVNIALNAAIDAMENLVTKESTALEEAEKDKEALEIAVKLDREEKISEAKEAAKSFRTCNHGENIAIINKVSIHGVQSVDDVTKLEKCVGDYCKLVDKNPEVAKLEGEQAAITRAELFRINHQLHNADPKLRQHIDESPNLRKVEHKFDVIYRRHLEHNCNDADVFKRLSEEKDSTKLEAKLIDLEKSTGTNIRDLEDKAEATKAKDPKNIKSQKAEPAPAL